jgi:hypothetical protein
VELFARASVNCATFFSRTCSLASECAQRLIFSVKPALSHPNVGDAIPHLLHNPEWTAGQQVNLTGWGVFQGFVKPLPNDINCFAGIPLSVFSFQFSVFSPVKLLPQCKRTEN